jgi:hypothetical protein
MLLEAPPLTLHDPISPSAYICFHLRLKVFLRSLLSIASRDGESIRVPFCVLCALSRLFRFVVLRFVFVLFVLFRGYSTLVQESLKFGPVALGQQEYQRPQRRKI